MLVVLIAVFGHGQQGDEEQWWVHGWEALGEGEEGVELDQPKAL